ncbi:hypothetical protein [Actinoplanes rectilineatus]|uniref:hypothetical protein n=1 Tax=Actinoplanes rectilineatus TaxID=113571 RepID=UPI0005F29BE6
MATRLVQMNMKARDDVTLGAFRAQALGWETSSEGPGVTNLEPAGLDCIGQGDDVSWVMTADPEGSEFCLLTPA